ncbi:MAG TPA: putative toxin-antitoxin system toxin component, PIN family [Gaiellaceae bacterium]|nr:putative toxin-antitoxin system toxin component, PIN family [Gaiellaceae bacterium]
MRVVVDTNVWISGLIVPASPPGLIVSAVRQRRIEVVGSWDLASELAAVLPRPKLRRYEISADDIRELLVLIGRDLPDVDVKVVLRDPRDAPVVAAAIAGHAEVIVTGDRDLLEDEELRAWLTVRDVEVLSPAELLERLSD